MKKKSPAPPTSISDAKRQASTVAGHSKLESEVGDQFHQRCEELPATDSILPSLEQIEPTSQREQIKAYWESEDFREWERLARSRQY